MPYTDIKQSNEIDSLWLQDMVTRGLAWLRKSKGITQAILAEKTGWKQPYISRLEDANSPILPALQRIERYASACGYSGIITFVDQETGEIAQTIALSENAEQAADALMIREDAPLRTVTPWQMTDEFLSR